MRRPLLAAALLAAIASPALAQRQGSYAVDGQAPNGQRYDGIATLAPTGQNTWQVTWRVGQDTANGVGLLIPEGPLFVVGYVMAGQEVGVVAYAVEPDGRLRGTWTQGVGGGTGFETLTPSGSGGAAPRK
ncbi:hypothetical protein GXW74_17320 [Roseomonas eburnea]|uniref:Uncharacterized protein n=1 Tax=Neoroseomonas eburnea TaxID=1346889 RepID=A0A9X9XEW9_9PROT|nr:hypothetical protein [Neoroseomonas eburnea]MBR0682255.1 hypothetical protein [Neoroseomonas eburnea]